MALFIAFTAELKTAVLNKAYRVNYDLFGNEADHKTLARALEIVLEDYDVVLKHDASFSPRGYMEEFDKLHIYYF